MKIIFGGKFRAALETMTVFPYVVLSGGCLRIEDRFTLLA